MKTLPNQPKDSDPKPNEKDELKSLPMPELLKKLDSSKEGLSQAEAQKRLTQYGPNEIEEKKINPFLKFLTYYWGPIPWMIEGAVILSGVVRHWPDFFIILLLLIANGVVGFWEERQPDPEPHHYVGRPDIPDRSRPVYLGWSCIAHIFIRFGMRHHGGHLFFGVHRQSHRSVLA